MPPKPKNEYIIIILLKQQMSIWLVISIPDRQMQTIPQMNKQI